MAACRSPLRRSPRCSPWSRRPGARPPLHPQAAPPTPARSLADRDEAAGSDPDEIDAALASAREAAAAAERAVAISRLSVCVRPPGGPVSAGGDPSAAAGDALNSLRAALALVPNSADLRHAVEDTERAIPALDRSSARTAPPGTAAATGR